MKKNFFLSLILFTLISWQSFGQKIIMKIPGVVDKGEEVTALTLDISAVTSWTKGGGASVGKPNPGSLTIKKSYSKVTADMLKKVTMGTYFSEVAFEYQDQAGRPYYTIVITGAFLVQLSWLTPTDCTNCPKLELQASFVYRTLKTTDMATGTTVTWEIPTGTVQ